jgi:NitT/TauT family transport system substrate-binding protein
MIHWRRPLAALVLFVVLSSGIPAGAADLKPLIFLPQWQPQAQFAGFYLALRKGYYRDYGIDLTLVPGGPDRSPATYLRENKADVVTLWLSTAMQLADQGVPVVNIGQIIQRSALVLAVKKRSGIKSPADMQGKKIALWPADFQIQPEAFFDKFNLDVQVVTTACPVQLFLRDGVQVASLMWYNEYHTLLNAGLNPEEMRLFFFEDVDLNFPEDGLYMRREIYEQDPGTACAFVAASLKGWREAFAHPEEAVDLMISIMEAAHLPANRMHQRWMLERLRDLSQPRERIGAMGDLRRDDYERVGAILTASGRIHRVPPFDTFFRKCPPHVQE